MSIKILLVDDHEVMCEGLGSLLRKQEHMEVIGCVGDGRSAVQMAKDMSPDVVIMDVGMPNLNGIDATRQLAGDCPNVKVLVLSTHSDGSLIAKALKVGASGYVLKDSAFTELTEAIETISQGKTYLCSKASKVVFADYVKMLSNPNWTWSGGLTAREREVLQLVAEGKTTKGIAATLHVSVKTVDSHREHIMDKLNIHNVAGLTKYAIREGLTFI
ncbi:MAG: response regulator [Planctomycetota bacterium]|jgi:DNA-binding NarL/FixJ family response regulator